MILLQSLDFFFFLIFCHLSLLWHGQEGVGKYNPDFASSTHGLLYNHTHTTRGENNEASTLQDVINIIKPKGAMNMLSHVTTRKRDVN